ncbi:hypothetical protein AB0B51_24680 [Streptomyces griseus]|uniref:hypothetical protein n=1 Tax=Streptomyces griseus TaxID=1911 RepID=UPI00131BE769|nr:hypothetical protein [Streptomyces griseus]
MNIDGLTTAELGRLLHIQWERRPGTLHTGGRRLASALIHMRRTRALRYHAAAHANQLANAPRTSLHLKQRALATGHPLGSRAAILGEPHTGVIVHTEAHRDPDDIYPSIWYIVDITALRLCRPHGTDEIEPLSGKDHRAPRAVREGR